MEIGTPVWIRNKGYTFGGSTTNEDLWLPRFIQSKTLIDGRIVYEVNNYSGAISAPDAHTDQDLDDLKLRNIDAEKGAVENLIDLLYLNEPEILHHLKRRYAKNMTYTYTGSVLIAIRPAIALSSIVSASSSNQKILKRFCRKVKLESADFFANAVAAVDNENNNEADTPEKTIDAGGIVLSNSSAIVVNSNVVAPAGSSSVHSPVLSTATATNTVATAKAERDRDFNNDNNSNNNSYNHYNNHYDDDDTSCPFVCHSILFSGEVGSGKTETSKLVMRYLATRPPSATHRDRRQDPPPANRNDSTRSNSSLSGAGLMLTGPGFMRSNSSAGSVSIAAASGGGGEKGGERWVGAGRGPAYFFPAAAADVSVASSSVLSLDPSGRSALNSSVEVDGIVGGVGGKFGGGSGSRGMAASSTATLPLGRGRSRSIDRIPISTAAFAASIESDDEDAYAEDEEEGQHMHGDSWLDRERGGDRDALHSGMRERTKGEKGRERGGGSGSNGGIGRKVLPLSVRNMLRAHTILESFGNAKIGGNNNGSRFGTYSELFFDTDGVAVAGRIETFLFEYLRVSNRRLTERNFHVFYQVVVGATDEERSVWRLQNRPFHYRFTSQSFSSSSSYGSSSSSYSSASYFGSSSLSGKGLSTNSKRLGRASLRLDEIDRDKLLPTTTTTTSSAAVGAAFINNNNNHQRSSNTNNNKVVECSFPPPPPPAGGVAGTGKKAASTEDDISNYQRLKDAFTALGFDRSETILVFEVIAGLLHLGQLVFAAGLAPDGTDTCEVRQQQEHNPQQQHLQQPQQQAGMGERRAGTGDVREEQHSLYMAAFLLGCDKEELESTLTSTRVTRGSEIFKKTLSVQHAQSRCDGMAKTMYKRLIESLVRRINSCIAFPTAAPNIASGVSILDIFGFVNGQDNTLEEMCINYANEALQQHFNQVIFKREIQIYEEEEIFYDKISYPDNQESMDLIGNSIFCLIDDQCRIPQPSDKRLANTLYAQLSGSKQHAARFSASSIQQIELKFSILHFAGIVEYNADGIVAKNSDELPADALALMEHSSNIFINGSIGNSEDSSDSSDFVWNVEKTARESARGKRVGGGGTSTTLGSPRDRGSDDAFTFPTRRFSRAARRGTSTTTIGGGGKQTEILQFKNQLGVLIRRIESTEPHYIRCIKPYDLSRDELGGFGIRLGMSSSSGAEEADTAPAGKTALTASTTTTSAAANVPTFTSPTAEDRKRLMLRQKQQMMRAKTMEVVFDPLSVAEQLRYSGILEVVQIARAGYPVKLGYFEFYARYRHLANPFHPAIRKLPLFLYKKKVTSENAKRYCRLLIWILTGNEEMIDKMFSEVVGRGPGAIFRLQSRQKSLERLQNPDIARIVCSIGWIVGTGSNHSLPLNSIQMGKTRVFLRRTENEVLERCRLNLLNTMVSKLQAAFRKYVQRVWLAKFEFSLVAVQRIVRGFIARRRSSKLISTHAAIVIQSCIRRKLVYRRMPRLRQRQLEEKRVALIRADDMMQERLVQLFSNNANLRFQKTWDELADSVAVIREIELRTLVNPTAANKIDYSKSLPADLIAQVKILLLENAALAPIGVTLAEKGVFSPTKDKNFIFSLVASRDVERYAGIVKVLVRRWPKLMLEKDDTDGYLICDKLKKIPDNRRVKFKLLADLVNHCADMNLESNLFSHFMGEEELIVRATAFGIPATPLEMRTKKFDFLKKVKTRSTSSENIFHLTVERHQEMINMPFYRENNHRKKPFFLAIQALKERVNSGLLDETVARRLLWEESNTKDRTLWQLALLSDDDDILEELSENWGGSMRPDVTNSLLKRKQSRQFSKQVIALSRTISVFDKRMPIHRMDSMSLLQAQAAYPNSRAAASCSCSAASSNGEGEDGWADLRATTTMTATTAKTGAAGAAFKLDSRPFSAAPLSASCGGDALVKSNSSLGLGKRGGEGGVGSVGPSRSVLLTTHSKSSKLSQLMTNIHENNNSSNSVPSGNAADGKDSSDFHSDRSRSGMIKMGLAGLGLSLASFSVDSDVAATARGGRKDGEGAGSRVGERPAGDSEHDMTPPGGETRAGKKAPRSSRSSANSHTRDPSVSFMDIYEQTISDEIYDAAVIKSEKRSIFSNAATATEAASAGGAEGGSSMRHLSVAGASIDDDADGREEQVEDDSRSFASSLQ